MPPLTEIQMLRNKVNRLDKEKRFAWFKFFEIQRNELSDNLTQLHQVEEIIRTEIPDFVKNQLTDMMKQLRKKVECPVCFDELNPEQIEFASCGHMYCKDCMPFIKEQKKCAVCRKTIY